MNTEEKIDESAHIGRQFIISIVAVLTTGVLVCGVYPLVVWGVSQVAFSYQANGSMVTDAGGRVVGSRLIGQTFTKPQYFHPRPSAAGSGYDPTQTSGSNLGPTNKQLISDVSGFAAAYRTDNGLAADAEVPVDAVTRSGSGCDPHISLSNAKLQAARVARARGMKEEDVMKLVDENTDGRDWGIFGEPGVNVLALNLALDKTGH
jgi:K+-transporting ATPase ATPase C chain